MGGGYYTDCLPITKNWVVWDKRQFDLCDRNCFCDCELAWASKGGNRIFRFLYNGFIQQGAKDYRFHPTQKPIGLFTQLLNYYTAENDLILDAFAGSQALRLACKKLNRRYIGFELDEEYYKKGCEWYNEYAAQVSMF